MIISKKYVIEYFRQPTWSPSTHMKTSYTFPLPDREAGFFPDRVEICFAGNGSTLVAVRPQDGIMLEFDTPAGDGQSYYTQLALATFAGVVELVHSGLLEGDKASGIQSGLPAVLRGEVQCPADGRYRRAGDGPCGEDVGEIMVEIAGGSVRITTDTHTGDGVVFMPPSKDDPPSARLLYNAVCMLAIAIEMDNIKSPQ